MSPEMIEAMRDAEEAEAGGGYAAPGPEGDDGLPGEPLPLSVFIASWDRFTIGPENAPKTYRIGEPTWDDQVRVDLLIRQLPGVVAAAVLLPAPPGSTEDIDVRAVAAALREHYRHPDGTPVTATDEEVAAELYSYSRRYSPAVQGPLLGIILIGLAETHPDVAAEELQPHLKFTRAVTVARRVLGLGGNMAADFLPPGGTGAPAAPPPPTGPTRKPRRTRARSTAPSS